MHFLFTEGHPEFIPGSEYAYRNSNFNILGLIVEKVTGNPYPHELNERILKPAELVNTYMLNYGIEAEDERIAHGYTQEFDGIDYHTSQPWAAGGLLSTASDLSLFMSSLMQGGLFEKSTTLKLMLTPVEGGHYGLGIFVTQSMEGTMYGHSGAIFGYNTRVEYFTEINSTIVSCMSFNGYDFMVVNWYDDFCYPIVREIRIANL
jgi:D-alanyl-D-alanine carboxypeptidase